MFGDVWMSCVLLQLGPWHEGTPVMKGHIWPAQMVSCHHIPSRFVIGGECCISSRNVYDYNLSLCDISMVHTERKLIFQNKI